MLRLKHDRPTVSRPMGPPGGAFRPAVRKRDWSRPLALATAALAVLLSLLAQRMSHAGGF